MTSAQLIEKDIKYVLVFRTNIRFKKDIEKIKILLDQLPCINDWNVDREDIDNILRVESITFCQKEIISLINNAGYYCEELTD